MSKVGEYWDTLAYEWDGTPSHNQDGHRQRLVNWINAAGGLATAFGEWWPLRWCGLREWRRGQLC